MSQLIFNALQYSGEFSFQGTANEIEPCVTGHMRAQWNFRGVKLLGALEKSGLITNINIIVSGEKFVYLYQNVCFFRATHGG